MDKLKMQTPDFTDENIRKLAELFPNCVTESRDDEGKLKKAIDFDQLRQELSTSVIDGPRERYQLNWPGKREALLAANAPIAKTLRPCREESVDFDTTKNLFIEGDNLDALKLLQETYLNKVKMIYIDPPYNTGNDFVYDDDFKEDTEAYFQRSNQKDEAGKRMVANTESNGRFHSDWLTMMYPRLKLARNLLREDGVIFISIDDNEVENLKKVCDEVFGEGNFIGQITVLCNPKGRSQDKYIANCHEYLLAYARNPIDKGLLNVPKPKDEISKNYRLKDLKGLYREIELRNTHREFGRHNRKNLYYPFYINDKGGISIIPTSGSSAVYPNWDDGFEGCWTWGEDKATKQLDELVARRVKGHWKIYRKNYALSDNGEVTKQVKSIWSDKRFHTEKGQASFNELFNVKGKIFQSPKSVDTLIEILLMSTKHKDIILDFFSGSATTAHAVIALNAEDGGNRKFIMVQLPENCDEKSEAFRAGYKTIADIGKERIRRAGKKIKDELGSMKYEKKTKDEKPHPSSLILHNLDIGFRVLKVDSSNMKDVYYAPDAVKQDDLFDYADNIREDRISEDLLFQVLLDWGVDLTLPISKEIIRVKYELGSMKYEGKAKDKKTDGSYFIPHTSSFREYEVFFVDNNALAACFEPDISEEMVKELAARKPLRVVFRDSGFASDSVKINVEQIFKLISPGTEVKVI